jgi:hypothetical protein
MGTASSGGGRIKIVLFGDLFFLIYNQVVIKLSGGLILSG